jgi:hypothetical protein
VRRHRLEHQRPRRDLGAAPHQDVAQHRGARADEDVVADLGVAVADLLAGAAERHVLQQRHVVADDGGLADHHPRAVVQQDAAAQPRRRVDVDGQHL